MIGALLDFVSGGSKQIPGIAETKNSLPPMLQLGPPASISVIQMENSNINTTGKIEAGGVKKRYYGSFCCFGWE
jgi:hypothetical protein